MIVNDPLSILTTMSVPANNVAAGGAGAGGGGKMCEHCQVVKAQAKVTFNGVTLKLCKACVDIEQKRVHLARLCERCAQGKQVSINHIRDHHRCCHQGGKEEEEKTNFPLENFPFRSRK
jgi:hypothetical protein